MRFATRATILACVGKAAENAEPKDLVRKQIIVKPIKPEVLKLSVTCKCFNSETKIQRNDSKVCDASFAKLWDEFEDSSIKGMAELFINSK